MDTFLSWIRLSLPTEVYENMLVENAAMVDLIFQQLTSEDEDNLQVAVNCIVELMQLSRIQKNNFEAFRSVVMTKVQMLQDHVQTVI